jgi:membrane associated rhomboid family serine protease
MTQKGLQEGDPDARAASIDQLWEELVRICTSYFFSKEHKIRVLRVSTIHFPLFFPFYHLFIYFFFFDNQRHMLLRRSPIPSLGASGAICGIFATFCLLYPHAELQLLILPGFSLEAQKMLFVPVVLECALLVFMRNRLGIDFAAHLGGFAFGAAYAWFLKQYAKRARRLVN